MGFKEGLNFAREIAISIAIDPVTITGSPELSRRVARWVGLNEKWQDHFAALAHISQAAYARTYLGDLASAQAHRNEARLLDIKAGFLRPNPEGNEEH